MPKPTDEKLYESIKKDLFKKYVKPSAYRSGLLVQRYKEEYIKKHKNNFVSRRDRTQTDHTVNEFNPKAPCVGEVRGSDRLHVDDWSGPASPRPPPPRLKLLRAKHCSSAGKTVSLRYYRWSLMLESNGRESSCYPSVWLLERNTRWLERRPSISMT